MKLSIMLIAPAALLLASTAFAMPAQNGAPTHAQTPPPPPTTTKMDQAQLHEQAAKLHQHNAKMHQHAADLHKHTAKMMKASANADQSTQ